jgi:serine/threonine protein kinase
VSPDIVSSRCSDLKPQNILLDATGHIMLADFGACARLDASGQVSHCSYAKKKFRPKFLTQEYGTYN